MKFSKRPMPMSDKALSSDLGVAYAVRRKKKMAEGGEVKDSAKAEKRPMPSETAKDSKAVAMNKVDKPARNDKTSSMVTVMQAQKPSITKLSRPSITKGTGPFSMRYSDMEDEEQDLIQNDPPVAHPEPDMRDEEEEDVMDGKSPDMSKEHNNGRKPYADGGEVEADVERSSAMPDAEEEEMEHASLAAQIMMKARKAKMLAEGGEVELANQESDGILDERQHAALKENYDDSMMSEEEPQDSNEISPEHEEEDIHDDSVVSAIRRKMRAKSPITK